MAKDEYIRFRCEEELAQRFETIAGMMRRTASDLARLVFEDFVTEQEKKLGITGAGHYGLKETAPPYTANSPTMNRAAGLDAAAASSGLAGAQAPRAPRRSGRAGRAKGVSIRRR